MTDPKQFAAAFGFDQSAAMDGINTVARFNERFIGLALDAARETNDIAARTTGEAIENVRTATRLRDEPAEYGQAVTEFARNQAALMGRATEEFGQVFQTAQDQAADLATEASERAGHDAAANVNAAAKKAERTRKSA